METMTNDSGYDEFSGIDPTRSYRVEEAIHPGWVNTTPLSETVPFTCSDFPNLPPSGTVNIQHNQGGFYWLITAKNIESGYDIVNSPPTYAGWCVDLDHQIGNGDHGVRLFISSLMYLTPLLWSLPPCTESSRGVRSTTCSITDRVSRCVWLNGQFGTSQITSAITTQNIGGCPLTNDQVNAALAFRNEVNANGYVTGLPAAMCWACLLMSQLLLQPLTEISWRFLFGAVINGLISEREGFGNISGLKVRAEDNEPLEGWEITLKYENGTIYRTTTTDVNGRFSF